MHYIEPRVEGGIPVAAAEEQDLDQSLSLAVAANQFDLQGSIQRSDGPHVAIVLNSVMRASSALLEATRGAAHSSASSVSGAETEIELEPYSFYLRGDGALTHHTGNGSKPRDGISTAPTLHSRSSTPPGTGQEIGKTQKTEETASREAKATTCRDGIFTRWLESFKAFWNKHISVQVPGKAARDHLGEFISFMSSINYVFISYESLTIQCICIVKMEGSSDGINPSPLLSVF
ncbi:hypothetical protein L211DRAFT_606196 [Terfezia boudieri ATCC MYA-4762]|uniref:Uncharacterized protein n=1 Tax=Terfezia boudieri ATCC MYA-4762 TaxID=1051890 RepID=A0A3N4LWB1_9PEZI|nr:hypothetical protein L211DRAFT_606196 [Terfezia boudieri ATCC MYA-4762]